MKRSNSPGLSNTVYRIRIKGILHPIHTFDQFGTADSKPHPQTGQRMRFRHGLYHKDIGIFPYQRIREREHGTLEHLLVMPVTSFEIMASKVWSMALVVMAAAGLSLLFVIRGMLGVPAEGSFALFMLGMALHLFAVTSLGIFLACTAQNMPQLGMLLILVLMPMQMLSGGMTPQESMPEGVRLVMQLAPTTHFVEFSQAILYRGAGLDVVWKPFLWLTVIGTVLFVISWIRFRRTMT